jgi:hypothetical protein
MVHLDDYSENRFFATEQGEDWLLRNEQKLNLRLPSAADSRPAIMQDSHEDYAQSAEISDDDIPF